jgi:hypothetical protein
VPPHEDDGGNVSQYETEASVDQREKKEQTARKKRGEKVIIPEEMRYVMFDEASSRPFAPRKPFNSKYHGHKKKLNHLREMKEMDLVDCICGGTALSSSWNVTTKD